MDTKKQTLAQEANGKSVVSETQPLLGDSRRRDPGKQQDTTGTTLTARNKRSPEESLNDGTDQKAAVGPSDEISKNTMDLMRAFVTM